MNTAPLKMWNLLKQNLKIHFKAPRQRSVRVYETNCILFWESNKPHKCMNSTEQILLQKLTVTQPVKFPTFYGTKCASHVHTSPTTGKYPQPHESRPHLHIHVTKIHFKLSCLLHSDFTCGLFLNLKSSN